MSADPVPKPKEPVLRKARWLSYVEAAGIVVTAAVLSGLVFGRSQLADVVMLFLLGIVIVSLRLGHGPSMFAAVLSVLVYDFFFIPPFYTFTVSDLRHVVTFAVMLLVATVINGLTRSVRGHAEAAREREHRTAVLYHLSRDLARAKSVHAILAAAAEHVAQVFASRIVVFVSRGDNLTSIYESAGLETKLRAELGVAHAAWRSRLRAGLSTPTFPESHGLYVPLVASRGSVGVMGLYPDDRHRFDDADQRYFLDTFASQMAAAMERADLAEEAEHQRIQVDTERLRNALLSSVSHDLRTPLAIIAGAASTLLNDEAHELPKDESRSLLQSIYDEGDRLNRLICNLLDMTRLESGTLNVKREWYPVEEMIGVALNRTEQRLKGRDIRVTAPPDLLAPVDGVLVEQALVNVLENAAKYTRPGSPVEIRAAAIDHDLVIDVADRGPGIAPGDEERIFEKFSRGRGETGSSGAGLGLAIARAIAVAHGGRLVAKNRDGGGATFVLTLPIEGEPPVPVGADADPMSPNAMERA